MPTKAESEIIFLARNGITSSEIAVKIKKTQANVAWYLTRLYRANLVARAKVKDPSGGRMFVYFRIPRNEALNRSTG